MSPDLKTEVDAAVAPDTAPGAAAVHPEAAGSSLATVLVVTVLVVSSLVGLWFARLKLRLMLQPKIEQLELALERAPVKSDKTDTKGSDRSGPNFEYVLEIRNSASDAIYLTGYDRSSLIVKFQCREGSEWTSASYPLFCGTGLREIALAPGEVVRVPCRPDKPVGGAPLRATLHASAELRSGLFEEPERQSLGTAVSNLLQP